MFEVTVKIIELIICDDCFKPYKPPVYYEFDPAACHPPHEGCTGNLCPECAGPFLEPAQPDDERRPTSWLLQ